VGGTILRFARGDSSYKSETAWSQATAPGERQQQPWLRDLASGGGESAFFPRPYYQRGLKVSRRSIPDVAFDAYRLPIVLHVGNGYISALGDGTSLAAPAWSGIAALADQEAGHRVGFLNPILYKLGRENLHDRAFHDVVAGSNSVRVMIRRRIILVHGFSAGPRWDEVTGWGTPRAAVLVPLIAAAARP